MSRQDIRAPVGLPVAEPSLLGAAVIPPRREQTKPCHVTVRPPRASVGPERLTDRTARFQRAVTNGHVGHAEIAAREIGRLQPADALSYTLLLVRARDPRALKAAHRWVRHARDDHGLTCEEADLLLSAVLAANGRFADAALDALATACRRLGLPRPVFPRHVRKIV